ncbi:MAG: VOC family protein [Cyanobium sp.]
MAEPEPTALAGSIQGSTRGSLVLAADDPAALARFYGALIDELPQQGLSSTHWRVRWPAGGWLEVYAPSRSRPQPRQQGRLALCLQRRADGTDPLVLLHSWIATVQALGASVEGPPRREPFGAEAWLLDPEANRLLLLVLP